jgi:hypothetical protein
VSAMPRVASPPTLIDVPARQSQMNLGGSVRSWESFRLGWIAQHLISSFEMVATQYCGHSMSHRIGVRIAALCVALTLSGCFEWEQRRGLDPVISAPAVELSTSNQIRILQALAADAEISLGSQGAWYEVTLAGFNFVDDECRTYFDGIFFLNRDKDTIKSELAAAGATTAAILGLTGASAKSIAIVAQAFGLGVVTTDVIAGTYLYQMPPSVAQGFVKEMQLAYRDGAASRQLLINSPSAAYHAIQDYLSLCLPPTIEAKIAEHVAGAKAVPDPPTGNGNTSFGITVASPRPATRADVRRMITGSVETPLVQSIPSGPRAPLPGVGRNPPPGSGELKMAGSTQTEKDTPQSVGQIIQANLCVTSPTTSFDSARDAIQQAKIGANQGRSRLFTNTENAIKNAAEAQLFLNATSPPCAFDPSEAGPQTAYEKFGFPDEASVTQLQQILKVCDASLNISGKFDKATRDAIGVAKGKINQARRVGLTDLSVNTLRANSFAAIQATCR